MKKIYFFILLIVCCCNLNAQSLSPKKQTTFGLHFFYNDFATPALIKASSLNKVISNKQWNLPQNMEGGFGIDYLKGITKKIDAIVTINASWVNYLLPGNILYSSSNFLLDINAGTHIKLFTDKKTFNPFLITKIGYTSYKNINGFSLLPGAGIQVNLFDDAFILTTAEYRAALTNSLSNQLYYSIGISTNLCKKKAKQLVPAIIEQPLPIIQKDSTPPVAVIIPVIKDLIVTVLDEATRQPLQFAEVTIKNNGGNVNTAITNADGKATFNTITADSFLIGGRHNKIDASTISIGKEVFDTTGNQVAVTITHNDPRFTLVGNTVDKAAGVPVGGTAITVTNNTQSSTSFATSEDANGEFRTQLESGSDFTILGKKADYISNIENISTKDLNRSATLYVKLQLGIQEAKAGTSIILNNIYFETGKAIINTTASTDLDKLVQFLIDNPSKKLEMQGHTDNTGSIATNTKLSRQRAETVIAYLVKKRIAQERLFAKGYGPTLPVADNNTPAGKAQNRRVEMKVLE